MKVYFNWSITHREPIKTWWLTNLLEFAAITGFLLIDMHVNYQDSDIFCHFLNNSNFLLTTKLIQRTSCFSIKLSIPYFSSFQRIQIMQQNCTLLCTMMMIIIITCYYFLLAGRTYPGRPPDSMWFAVVTSSDHTSYCHFFKPRTPLWTLPMCTPTLMLRLTPVASRTLLSILVANQTWLITPAMHLF